MKGWNWTTWGTKQCGKRKWWKIRSLAGQSKRVKRYKHRQRDRKNEGDPTLQSRRMDGKGGINSWIQLLSKSFLPAARGWSCPSRHSKLFSFSLSLSLTCSRQSRRQSVRMKFPVPQGNHISQSSFLARCGQETPWAGFYLSQSLLHSQHSVWLHHNLCWPSAITLESWALDSTCIAHQHPHNRQLLTKNSDSMFLKYNQLVAAPVMETF